MFTLIATTNKSEGSVNVPVLDIMTNEQVAQAVLSGFKPDFKRGVIKCTNEVKEFVKTLRNAPDEVFCDPCYDVMQQEDCFVLSFGFIND